MDTSDIIARKDVHILRAENERLVHENAALHERLEDNYAWQFMGDGEEMVRVAMEPGSMPDGIECRDETIKLLEEESDRLTFKRDELRAAFEAHSNATAVTIRDALHERDDFANRLENRDQMLADCSRDRRKAERERDEAQSELNYWKHLAVKREEERDEARLALEHIAEHDWYWTSAGNCPGKGAKYAHAALRVINIGRGG